VSVYYCFDYHKARGPRDSKYNRLLLSTNWIVKQVVHWIGKPDAEACFGAPARERSGMHAQISALRF